MASHIKLTKPFKLGKKTIKAGIICAFDRRTMDRLVKEGSAYFCGMMGTIIPHDEEE